ncbi:MAG: FHA domain-containing protein [Rhodospirillaceae bacterium]|nr:MAG: FHA domain-containing protein [Rhodospirillaceae bacterium]
MSDTEDKTIVALETLTEGKPAAKASLAGLSPAHLVCIDTSNAENLTIGQKFPIAAAEVFLGRDSTCTIPITAKKLSRRHARIFAGAGTWGIEDLDSTNGVYVNDAKITSAWLKHHDEIRLGSIRFRFELERPAFAERSVAVAPAAEDTGEHTIAAGSFLGGQAMLAAVQAAETDQKRNPEADSRRTRTTVPQAAKGRGSPLVYFLMVVLVAAAGIGAVVYYGGGSDVDRLIEQSERIAERVVQHSHDQNLVQIRSADHAQDIAALEKQITQLAAARTTAPDNEALANIYAQLLFLRFERQYVKLLENDLVAAEKLTEVLAENIGTLTTPLPKADRVTTVRELTKLAAIIVRFRRFAQTYKTQTANAPPPPPQALAELVEPKNAFNHLMSRVAGSASAVRFAIFSLVAKETGERDVAIYTEWADHLSV